jgi:hypothetical protein
MAEGPVGRWGIQQDRLNAARVRAMVEQVAAAPPTWADGIRSRPEPGAGRDRWEADVGVIVAYRDQFRITDDTDPLGVARVRGHQQQVRQAAGASWQRVEHHVAPPDPDPVSANERRRAAGGGRRAAGTVAIPGRAGRETGHVGLLRTERLAAKVLVRSVSGDVG